MSNKIFKEEYLFTQYKDKAIKNATQFKGEIRKKYGVLEVDLTELYRKIVNYQIKKYGKHLIDDGTSDIPYEVIQKRSHRRRNANRRNRGLRKETEKDKREHNER